MNLFNTKNNDYGTILRSYRPWPGFSMLRWGWAGAPCDAQTLNLCLSPLPLRRRRHRGSSRSALEKFEIGSVLPCRKDLVLGQVIIGALLKPELDLDPELAPPDTLYLPHSSHPIPPAGYPTPPTPAFRFRYMGIPIPIEYLNI